jgi:hypothetical protein
MSNDFGTGLSRSAARLSAQWGRATDEWKDAVARRFETAHWSNIEAANKTVLTDMDDLSEEIERIQYELDQL